MLAAVDEAARQQRDATPGCGPAGVTVARVAAGVVTLGLLCALAWRVADSFADPVEPLWTENDLPARVRSHDNGWVVVRDRIETTELDEATVQLLNELLDPNVAVSERRRIWAREREALLAAEARYRDAFAAAPEALRRPRFSDDCPTEIAQHGDCPALELFALTRWWAIEQLTRAHRGQLPLAIETARDSLRALLDLQASSRRLMTAVFTQLVLTLDLSLVELLVALLPPGEPVPEADALLTVLDTYEGPRVEQAYRGEYVSERAHIDMLIGETRARTNFWMVHPRACTEAHNRFHRQLVAAAMDRSQPPPIEPVPGEETPWYISNRICDLALGLLIDTSQRAEAMRSDDAVAREVVARSRSAIQARTGG